MPVFFAPLPLLRRGLVLLSLSLLSQGPGCYHLGVSPSTISLMTRALAILMKTGWNTDRRRVIPR